MKRNILAISSALCALIPFFVTSLAICPEDELPCLTNSSHCIERDRFCNNATDCQDESDELYCSCPQTPARQLKCNLSLAPSLDNCVLLTEVCDGIPDCPDGQDENFICGGCDVNMYECPEDGGCVSVSTSCDDTEDCAATGFDENPLICGCPSNTELLFPCGGDLESFLCLETTELCSESTQCESARDEFCFDASTNSTVDSSPSISTGAIIGIVVGAVAAVVLASIILALVVIVTSKAKHIKTTKVMPFKG